MSDPLIAPEVGHLLEGAPAQAARLLLAAAQEMRKDFDALDQDRVNILAGMDWCLQYEQWNMMVDYAHAVTDFLDARGHWHEARSRLTLAIEACQRLGNKRREGFMRHNLGIIYAYQGRYAEAREQYQRCLAIWETLGDKQGKGAALAQLGSTFLQQGNLGEADPCYRQARAILEETGDKQGLGTVLHSLGVIQAMRGNVLTAVAYFEESLRIKTELSDKQGMAAALHEIGLLYTRIGRDDRARECYELSLELWHEVGDERGEVHTLAALGHLVQSTDLAQAQRLWQQSLSIAQRLQMPIASELSRLLQVEDTSK